MSEEANGIPEPMAALFAARTAGYDECLRGSIFSDKTFAPFCGILSSPIPETNEPLNILDLGCGTGLEFEAMFQRAPHAQITGVDLSTNILEQLQRKYSAHTWFGTLQPMSWLRERWCISAIIQ